MTKRKKKPTGTTPGERLRSARRNAGLTRQQLATAACVARGKSGVSAIERDDARMGTLLLWGRLADEVGVTVDDLLG